MKIEKHENSFDNDKKRKQILLRRVIVATGAVVLMSIIVILAFITLGHTDNASHAKASLNEYPLVQDRDVEIKLDNDATSFASSEEIGGDITINKNEIGENALIYTYTTKNDVTMQVIFVLTSDGALRVGLNTSEECKGEPDSYFVPGEGVFKCAHCGRVVSAAEVGRGTNIGAPAEISFSEEDDFVVIKESDLLASESYFTNWKGPIE